MGQDDHAVGIQLLPSSRDRCLACIRARHWGWVGGHAAGAANAQIALQHTPAEYSGPIYMACDAELLGSDLDIALGYIRGASSILAPERTGVYGEGALCEMVYNYGYATWCWQSASTSFPGNAKTLAITDI